MKATNGTLSAIVLLTIIGLYGLAYILSTEIFHGRTNSTRYRIRLFQSEMHRQIFAPLSFLESIVSPRDREFSDQVGNHASLPPPE